MQDIMEENIDDNFYLKAQKATDLIEELVANNQIKIDRKRFKSLRMFGFQQPLVVDKNNVLIIGHGRLLAAKHLHLEEVPCVKAEDLDKEQVKALRLADNKVAESDWDMDLLKDELNDIFDIDMSDFGFDLDLDDAGIFDTEKEEKEDDRDPSCQHNVFENQDTMQFPCLGKYGIPEMQVTQTTGDQMLRFMDWKEFDNPRGIEKDGRYGRLFIFLYIVL